MLEAQHAARLARQIGNEDLALTFDLAYQEAERQRVFSLAVENLRREVVEQPEIIAGTDLAGVRLGLRAFDFAMNLSREQVVDLADTNGTKIQLKNAYLRSVEDDPEIPTHFVVTVQNPGDNYRLLQVLSSRYRDLPDGIIKGNKAASILVADENVPKTYVKYHWQDPRKDARGDSPVYVDVRPGFYIGIDPLNTDYFGRIAMPGFVRTENGILLAQPTPASFASRTDLTSQQFATALLDHADI